MSDSGKTRKIVVLATGAAVALSATAIVMMQQHAANSEHAAIQRALRDGADHAKNTSNASEWFKMACRAGATCND